MIESLYLHIGFEKTGTTSLQNYCYKNARLLAKNGILYSRTSARNSHWGLMAYALDEDQGDRIKWSRGLNGVEACRQFKADFRTAFAEEVGDSAAKTVVLSLEQLSSRITGRAEASRLRDLFHEAGIPSARIVVYLRPQAEFITSLYSTKVKTGQATERFSLPAPGDPEFDFYTYLPTLNIWASVFGEQNIIVRSFQRARLANGDIVDDFFSTIGAPPAAGQGMKIENLNKSLDPVTLEMMRRLNPYLGPLIDEHGSNRYRAGLRLLLEKIVLDDELSLSTSDTERFMGSFETTNREIATRFLAGQTLFDPITGKGDKSFHECRVDEHLLFAQLAKLLKAQRDALASSRD